LAQVVYTPGGTSGWSNTSGNTAITNATAVPLMAANPTMSYYLTGLQITNYLAAVGIFQILDGNTVIFTGAPGSNVPYIVNFQVPLRGTVNNAISIQAAATANLFYSCQGYMGASPQSI
jgi:hypothetical protein